MRSYLIVVQFPLLSLVARILKAQEPMLVEALLPDQAVEGLDVGILSRAAGMNVECAGTFVCNPLLDREAFEAYVQHCLVHHLPSNAIVVMDNLSSHKSSFITHAIEQAGAQLR